MGIWNDLVSASLGSSSPSKTVFVIGGSKEAQNLLIRTLYYQSDSFLQSIRENPIANTFDLGYTYIQYKDDSKDLLSTLQIYTLPFDFKKDSITKIFSNSKPQDVLVIPLLDYSDNPHSWLLNLNLVLTKLTEVYGVEDDALPFELLQVVFNKQRRFDWDQDIHEHIQTFLRTISLKYNGSLIYVDLNKRSTRLLDFVSSILQIPVKEGKIVVEPNLVDSSSLLIPKRVDTWRKIQTVKEDFDAESYSNLWKLGDPENEVVAKYQSIVPIDVPATQTNSHKKKEVLENLEESKTMTYQEFLNELYDNKQKTKLFF